MALLILIALGYMLLQSHLGDLDIVIPVVFIVVVINVLLVGFSKIKDDASYKFYENEGLIGWLVVGDCENEGWLVVGDYENDSSDGWCW